MLILFHIVINIVLKNHNSINNNDYHLHLKSGLLILRCRYSAAFSNAETEASCHTTIGSLLVVCSFFMIWR